MDVYIGWQEQVHDARVFANSMILRKAEGCYSDCVSEKINNPNNLNHDLLLIVVRLVSVSVRTS